MKLFDAAKLFCVFILLFFSCPSTAGSFDGSVPNLQKGYYLVVGAFKIPSNAIRYSNFINARGENSLIGKNPDKDLFYVYVFSSPDPELVRNKRARYRSLSEFSDAWIFRSNLGQGQISKEEKSLASSGIGEQEMLKNPAGETEALKDEAEPEPELVAEELQHEGYRYLFNVVGASNLKEVPGSVAVVDKARGKLLTNVETNVFVTVPDPGTASGEVIFICDIFGYVKQQTVVKLEDPLSAGAPNVTAAGDSATVVSFNLIRHKAGDIIVMYNVYFYNDGAIMKPESKYELGCLLNMLNENKNLKIKIHGHTNGNAHGKIVKMREGDNNFFEVSENNIVGYGSAKELSLERARAIKNWLISKGIDKNRMQLKGWGGRRMLYGKRSENAEKNVRVEIEILKD